MPLKLMTREIRSRSLSRALDFGPPNSRKTTALIKTALYPLHVVSFPGEMGWATIPEDVPGLKSFVWEEAPSDPVSAESMRKEVEDTVFQILAGKHGPCRTLGLEGLHKLYDVYMNVATAGSFGRGEDFDAARYGRAHQMASSFLRKVLSSPNIERMIVTTWNARESDKAGERQGESHEWPDLPGKMAKLSVGMFSVVVFSQLTPMLGKPGEMKEEWLLKRDGEVWGASVKMDPRVAAKLPTRVPQNWQNLYKLIGAAEKEVESEGKELASD